MTSKEFFEALGLTKTFKFKGKKYKWICTWWQFIIMIVVTIIGIYAWMLSFFILDVIIN